MSAAEMKDLVDSLVALPSDEERMKVMDPMSDETKHMLIVMMKGMGVDMTKRPARTENKPSPPPKAQKPQAPPATEGFMGRMNKVKQQGGKESFTGTCGSSAQEPFAAQKKKPVKAVEPFDGEVYALF